MTLEQRKKANAASRRWQIRNRSKVAAYARKYRRKPIAREKHVEYTRRWRLRNPEKYQAQLLLRKKRYHSDINQRIRQADKASKSGITMDRFFEMLAEQSGKCKLCGEAFGQENAKKPVADHDHKTGAIRGIVHNNCNLGLGMFRDNPVLCRLAGAYLEATPKPKVVTNNSTVFEFTTDEPMSVSTSS